MNPPELQRWQLPRERLGIRNEEEGDCIAVQPHAPSSPQSVPTGNATAHNLCKGCPYSAQLCCVGRLQTLHGSWWPTRQAAGSMVQQESAAGPCRTTHTHCRHSRACKHAPRGFYTICMQYARGGQRGGLGTGVCTRGACGRVCTTSVCVGCVRGVFEHSVGVHVRRAGTGGGGVAGGGGEGQGGGGEGVTGTRGNKKRAKCEQCVNGTCTWCVGSVGVACARGAGSAGGGARGWEGGGVRAVGVPSVHSVWARCV